MQYLWLLVIIVMISAQSVLSKQYDSMTKEANIFFFSMVTSFVAMAFFIVQSGFKLTFSMDYLLYSVGFGLSYVICMGTSFLAIIWGSMSITGLVLAYSLVIPTFYGLFVLDENIGIIGMLGIGCLLISIFLINDIKGECKFSLKYIICLLAAFVSNGMCSTIQKMQQLACDGAYKNEFMIIALMISTVTFWGISLIRKEKVQGEIFLCAGLGALKGMANGIVNLLVMVLAGMIPNAILFPSVSAGGVVLSFVIAVTIYKERLSKRQLLGYVIGTASVVILNL